MAVVSTNKIKISGNDFVRKINCDSYGVFSARLPENVSEIIGENDVSAKTLDECATLWMKTVSNFYENKIEEKIVILFSTDRGHWEKENKGIDISIKAGVFREKKITDGVGNSQFSYDEYCVYGFDSEEHIFPEIMERENDIDRDRDNCTKHGIPYSLYSDDIISKRTLLDGKFSSQVPYTLENISFFVSIASAAEKLRERINSILSSPAKLTSFISGGNNLLTDQRTKG